LKLNLKNGIMKKNLIRLFWSTSSILCAIVLFAFVAPQDQKTAAAWVVPAKYKAMKNPTKGDAASANVGKMLYAKHCKSCHGGMGLGDGPKASSMKTKIGSFKDAKFQSQADGEIYYQTYVGRDEMTPFDKKIAEEEDRWAVVNFLRTLK
jgi:mono/diheme cytochrome c family protein